MHTGLPALLVIHVTTELMQSVGNGVDCTF